VGDAVGLVELPSGFNCGKHSEADNALDDLDAL
jgi:hypothetical protein